MTDDYASYLINARAALQQFERWAAKPPTAGNLRAAADNAESAISACIHLSTWADRMIREGPQPTKIAKND